jgi:hypothetical protein
VTIKSIVELLAQADTALADNTTGDITPSDIRTLIKDFLDTISPAYGAIACTSSTETLSATPQVIAPFTSALAAAAGYYTTNLTNGAVTRLIQTAGIAGATDFTIASGSVSGANNANVLVELYKNGAPTGYRCSVTCTGAGDAQGFNIAGLTYTASPGDAVFDLRATGPAGSYVFTNVTIVIQAQPVRSFT